MVTTINLRDYYPWYTHDEFIEVSDEVAAELRADKMYEKHHKQNIRRYKAFYSLDVEDGIETSSSTFACHSDNPEVIFFCMERFCEVCRALNSLPEIQGRRVEARYLLGKSAEEIAAAEGVCKRSVNESIERGLRAMKKYLQSSPENSPPKCPDFEAGI